MSRVRGVVCAVLALGVLLGVAATANADVVWLCKPGASPNPCRESLRTTVHEANGSTRVTDPGIDDSAPIDCFYVYPTTSDQQTTNATKAKDDEIQAIARYQAQRYSSQCRVYAPVYRQLTVASIYTGTPAARAAGRKIAYGDVREAFREYLARDNEGRGFVLIGHSQGTGMLRQLIRDEVDDRPAVRRRLVSALLLGGNVAVRKGKLSGGDFDYVPGCTSSSQTGCVIAYSIFNEEPPANPRFGKVPAEDTTGAGLPAGPEYEVLCTNPGSLRANTPATFTTLLPSEPFPTGTIALALTLMYGGAQPTAPTPWLQPADRYIGKCETINGANVLLVNEVGAARRLRPSPTPDWGLHLADANMPLGELVDVVRSQSLAYRRARQGGGTSGTRRCPKGSRRVAVRARRIKGVRIRRVTAYAGGRRVGRAKGRRVKVRTAGLRRGRVKVRLRIVGERGSKTVRRTQRRTITSC